MFGNLRLKMLNREAASGKNKPEVIIKSLDIKNGMIIADIGAGEGYFTFEFSKTVGENGRVYAVDTSQNALAFISNKSKEEMINNIKAILAYENGFMLPETADLFFLRNVFHHLSNSDEYLQNIKRFLKRDGKLAIIDHQKNGFSFIGLFDHFVPEEMIIETVEKAGFRVLEKFDFLPNQAFILFEQTKSV